jgi:glucose/arabinose dehydrogenase
VLAVLVVAAVAVVAACSDRETGRTGGTPERPAGTTPVITRGEESRSSGVPDLAAGQEVARGIDVPWGLAFLPGGDALVAERDTGQVLQISVTGAPSRTVYEPRTVYDVPGVAAAGEGGLLGLAVSPRYADDRYVYAYLTSEGDNRVVRFRLDGGQPEVLFAGIAKADFHNGGRIAFGPDGMLYVGTGDAGRRSSSQDRGSPNGKILRLTPEGSAAPGNPTSGSPVYSLGHRNVQGLAWDHAGRLFAGEFGQNRFDEVNLIEPGHNYGWPKVEGIDPTNGGPFTNPLVTWSPRDASPSGIAIVGDTLYVAALRGERLWTVPIRPSLSGDPSARFENRYGRLRTVEVAPDGALWLTTSNTDGRGEARAGDDRIIRFPAR